MIMRPLRARNPTGLVILQQLLRALCLRRRKDMKVDGKPLVVLPGRISLVKYTQVGLLAELEELDGVGADECTCACVWEIRLGWTFHVTLA